jgi:hypothetical protein
MKPLAATPPRLLASSALVALSAFAALGTFPRLDSRMSSPVTVLSEISPPAPPLMAPVASVGLG